MRIVSPLLKNAVYPFLSKSGVLRHLPAQGLAVVTYHGVLPEGYTPIDPALDGNLITAESLQRQLHLLKKHYDVISPDDFLAWREGKGSLPRRAVLVTCDDGLLNCLTDMLPVLRREEVRCLFFVTGASAGDLPTTLWYEDLSRIFLGAANGTYAISYGTVTIELELNSPESRRASWWSSLKRLSQVGGEVRKGFLLEARSRLGINSDSHLERRDSALSRRFGLLTATELNELSAVGMTIGAHTMTHPMLSQAPSELAYMEIAESRARLQDVLKKPVWAFAYPFGNPQSVTSQVLTMPKQAGFTAAFLNCGGGLGTPLPKFALPRLHVTSSMSLGEFEAHVSGLYAWLQRASHQKAQPLGLVEA
jgi:peptidoglycan/xylan/chitin deacetylase (PgdA/CDA1 family)